MNTDYNNGSGQLLGGAAASKEGGGSSSHAFPAQGGVISISFCARLFTTASCVFSCCAGTKEWAQNKGTPPVFTGLRLTLYPARSARTVQRAVLNDISPSSSRGRSSLVLNAVNGIR